MSKVRYPRPSLEIEYDKAQLNTPGCCRFVDVVVRLSGLSPFPVDTTIQCTAYREKMDADQVEMALGHDAYKSIPQIHYCVSNHQHQFDDWELHLTLLARPSYAESGRVEILVLSQAHTTLSRATYRLDTRHPAITQEVQSGSFTSVRVSDHILTDAERQQLNGFVSPAPIEASDQPTLF